jgi:starch phosphorylase
LFRSISAHRFALTNDNPVRLLRSLPERELLAVATDERILERAAAVADALAAERERPSIAIAEGGPVAFLCAEFGIHGSLPIYSGGLGVLAGDYLKECSDAALDVVGVGLLYRRGYFHQRMDLSGWQHEYWVDADLEQLAAVRVTGDDGRPIRVTVPVWDTELVAHVWRVDVGRVPLFLLDTEVAENAPLLRWVSSRLYEGSREIRLAQYALLGVGGLRALSAMSIEPGLIHLNEGHAVPATLEYASRVRGEGGDGSGSFAELLDRSRGRFAFTTHTPVPAGNETYGADELFAVLGATVDSLGLNRDEVASAGRIDPNNVHEPVGLSPLAIRASGTTNAVSERHGEIARSMWQPMFATQSADDVPISFVTNGVHLPTWMGPRMRTLLTECFGDGWERHATDNAMWDQLDGVPDAELWRVRCESRSDLVDLVRRKIVVDRLARGEGIDYVRSAADAFDPGFLTIGFARRMATYKRLGLLAHDPERVRTLLDHEHGAQFVLAGKAHPNDDEAKSIGRTMFDLKRSPVVRNRIVFMEDYDLRVAQTLMAGCDVWLNLPRPPLEASGTSGMKAALNGSLNLSVLDGWWAEAYDGSNGWAIDGSVADDDGHKDARDAGALYDLLEHEVKPLFFARDANGVPLAWVAKVRHSLRTLAPRFSSARMVDDYRRRIYPR